MVIQLIHQQDLSNNHTKIPPHFRTGAKYFVKEFNPSLMVDYSSSFFLPGMTNPNPARITLAAAPKIDNS